MIQPMDRRRFMADFPWARFAMAVWLLAVVHATATAQPVKPRPNVLWICADDHAVHAMGAYGNKRARTPNLDRLAASGTRFDRAYCNSPVCTASRMSFLTGRYPRSIGVTQLATALSPQEATIADILKAAGYRTIGIGKMHFNSRNRHGFDQLVDVAEYRRWLKSLPLPALPAGIRTLGIWRPFRDPAAIWLNAGCLPEPVREETSLGRFLADRCAAELTTQDPTPLFAFVSFHEPHSPFHFPIEYAGLRRAEEFVAPAFTDGDRPQIPEIFATLTDRQKMGIQAAYHTSTQFMDACVGRVLAALERSGKANNTLVVYTGDHGYMLGEHGRFEKHCGYEPAIRAPLLVRWPGAKGPQSTNELVELVDVVPTILDWCGLAKPPNLQGRTMLPTLQGEVHPIREAVFSAYAENEEAYVVTSQWKLIYGTGTRIRRDGYQAANPTPGRSIRLYDLVNDPEELCDLAGSKNGKAVVNRLLALLCEHLRATLPAGRPVGVMGQFDFLDQALQPMDNAAPVR